MLFFLFLVVVLIVIVVLIVVVLIVVVLIVVVLIVVVLIVVVCYPLSSVASIVIVGDTPIILVNVVCIRWIERNQ